jgi:hypothetical protein
VETDVTNGILKRNDRVEFKCKLVVKENFPVEYSNVRGVTLHATDIFSFFPISYRKTVSSVNVKQFTQTNGDCVNCNGSSAFVRVYTVSQIKIKFECGTLYGVSGVFLKRGSRLFFTLITVFCPRRPVFQYR